MLMEKKAHPLNEMQNEVIEGLLSRPRRLPSKYFYDARGSKIFEKICSLPEYYPTRTELGILKENIDEIADLLGTGMILYEFGSGASVKTKILLESLHYLIGYVPIDISLSALKEATKSLRREYPELDMAPWHADFGKPMEPTDRITKKHPWARRVVFFPGSTIGNLNHQEAKHLLEKTREMIGPKGLLLIGVDCPKDPEVLERAYNDSEGLTAAFNLNMLRHLNRELNCGFDLRSFKHQAFYNHSLSRIEMHLVCKQKTWVDVSGHTFHFSPGDHIQTENSYKYTPQDFQNLLNEAGMTCIRHWSDPKSLFGLYLAGPSPL